MARLAIPAMLAAAVGAAALLALVQAPAWWMAARLAKASGGQLQLLEPEGSLWQGSGRLVLGDRRDNQHVLPGRWSWAIRPLALLHGELQVGLRNAQALDPPLELRADLSGVARTDGGRLRLPASVLEALGAPWNTIRPGGTLELSWDAGNGDRQGWRGGLHLEWFGACSGLNPVCPFGHYRLDADGIYNGAALRLVTVDGPMEMEGDGTIRAGLDFHGTARVRPGTDAALASQLSGLVALLGRHEGDGVVLNLGI
jgi:general secretion pathway protein N